MKVVSFNRKIPLFSLHIRVVAASLRLVLDLLSHRERIKARKWSTAVVTTNKVFLKREERAREKQDNKRLSGVYIRGAYVADSKASYLSRITRRQTRWHQRIKGLALETRANHRVGLDSCKSSTDKKFRKNTPKKKHQI